MSIHDPFVHVRLICVAEIASKLMRFGPAANVRTVIHTIDSESVQELKFNGSGWSLHSDLSFGHPIVHDIPTILLHDSSSNRGDDNLIFFPGPFVSWSRLNGIGLCDLIETHEVVLAV